MPAREGSPHEAARYTTCMIGILIIAHASYGEALVSSASHVLGHSPARVAHLGMTVREDPDAMLRKAKDLVRRLDEGDGVLILTDILGGTPANIATLLAVRGRVEAVAGVNLPMLVRSLTYRNEPLATLVQKAVSGGQEGVLHVVPEIQNADRRD